NPAGGWPTKNWPLTAYGEFARLWQRDAWSDVGYVILGTPNLAPRAKALEETLGPSGLTVINLVGRTTQVEAFAMVRRASLFVSGDWGLMHMGGIPGGPPIALFGASRAAWSAPQGSHPHTLDSSDFPCGPCMNAVCAMGNIHCLTRQTPARVFEIARALTA